MQNEINFGKVHNSYQREYEFSEQGKEKKEKQEGENKRKRDMMNECNNECICV